MTYPPPGGYDPNQPGGQPPQQPSDPYNQGYNSAPPPAPQSYELSQPPQYSSQPPTNPGLTPPVNVHPGYPPGTPSPLPPQVIPQTGGGNKLPLILGIVVALVVVLGVVAILVVPGMVGDDDSDQAGGSTATEEPEPTEEPTEDTEPTEDPEPTEEPTEDIGGDIDTDPYLLDGWGEPVNSDDYDVNTPEGVAIEWKVLADDGDTDAMAELMCESPTENLEWQLEWAEDYAPDYNFLIWGMSREKDGQTQVWANWTWDDSAPDPYEPDNTDMDHLFTVVEEDGTWKICDFSYY